MRRTVIAFAILLVLVVAADQVVRVRIQDAVEEAAATGFSAATAHADVRGLLVLPQLLAGQLDEVDIRLEDAVIGDPAVRVLRLDAALAGVSVGFPLPTDLTRVDLDDGRIAVAIQEREVERLLREERPGWNARVTDAGVVATGTVEGAEVRVTAEVVVDGQALRFRAREVDAGALGPSATQAVAAAFDVKITLGGLPEGVELTGARTEPGRLLVDARARGSLGLVNG